jgi:hypothetical protein
VDVGVFQASLAGGHPPRIIRLSDLEAGMSEKTRNVTKLHSVKKGANRESIP